MAPADVVCEVFGGMRAVSRILNIAPSTVLRWVHGNGMVPVEHQEKLLLFAKSRDKRLTVEELLLGRVGITRQIVRFGSHTASPKVEPIGALGSMARALTRGQP